MSQEMTVQEELPEILRQIQAAFEANVNPESEVRISRMAIMQPGSPEVVEQKPGYKQGMIVDSLTREPLTDYALPPWLIERGVAESELRPMHFLLLIPVFKLPTEYIKWIPRSERKEGMDRWEFKTLDKKDPRVIAGVWKSLGGVFGTKPDEKGKAPPVTDNCNYLCLVVDPKTGTPKANFLVATFAKTSANAGKQLTTALATNKLQGLTAWGRAFWLYTELKAFQQPGEPKPTHAYITHIVRGPETNAIASEFTQMQILHMARALSAPGSGVLLQTAFINSADLDATDGGSDEAAGEGGVGGATLEEDPFQEPLDATPKPGF